MRGKPALPRPAAVAVHDDRDMARQTRRIQARGGEALESIGF